MSRRMKIDGIRRIMMMIIMACFLLFLFFPLYWMLVTSFKSTAVLFNIPPEWIPAQPVLDHYVKLFSDNAFVIFYKNSLIVSIGTTILTLVLASLAGYAFSRFKFKSKEFVMFSILATQILPVVSILIALYTMYNTYGLLNTRTGLVIALTSASLPFAIWMIKVFFDNIPLTIEEAAKIDGCSRFGILFRIVFPLSKPGVFAVGIYSFILSWDDFLYSLTLINKDELRTLNPGIAIRYMGEFSYDWGNIMTVSVTSTVPIVILFLFFQKYMISGLTAGAVKE